jgi:hypothetical protein
MTGNVTNGDIVSFNTSDPSTGSFMGTCTLASDTCSVTYTDTLTGSATITATYTTDGTYASATGTTLVTITPLSPPSSGGSGNTGGGAGGGVGGGGTSLPTVLAYSSGTRKGYQITNITNHNSETLHLGNNTKTINITINFITPTSAGITANNKAYNLTVGSPVALMDPNNYTYYAELTDISYLPILHTITLLVYGQPNTPITTTITTPIPTATVPTIPTTTIPPPTTTVPASTTVGITPPASTSLPSSSGGSVWLLVGIISVIVVVILLGSLYYYRTKNSRNGRKK